MGSSWLLYWAVTLSLNFGMLLAFCYEELNPHETGRTALQVAELERDGGISPYVSPMTGT
jgi:hypothetical protein